MIGTLRPRCGNLHPDRFGGAMTRYFFNLHESGTVLRDEEGRLLSYGALRDSAVRDARFILSAEILNGAISLDGSIVIEDDRRREVMRVPFRDAFTIDG